MTRLSCNFVIQDEDDNVNNYVRIIGITRT